MCYPVLNQAEKQIAWDLNKESTGANAHEKLETDYFDSDTKVKVEPIFRNEDEIYSKRP